MTAGLIMFPGLAQLLKWIDETGTGDRRKTRQAFYGLKRRGMIKTFSRKNKVEIILTQKGKEQLAMYRLFARKQIRPATWDGRWWLVMFDVPESRRTVRDLVRHKLKRAGFLTIQKSVMVYPFECRDLIFELRNYYRLQPGELYIFETKVIEGEYTLKKHFKI